MKLRKSESEHLSLVPTMSPRRWWSRETVAIVTGGNRGIGYAVVKRLSEMGITVILTARHSKRGSDAVEALCRQGLSHLHFFCLDVAEPSSIRALVAWFSSNFSALDILVNNAAVSFNEIGHNSVENAQTVMQTNFFGAKLLTHSLLPFFRRPSPATGRILNITSRLGSLDKLQNPNLREILERESVTEEEIEGVAKRFVEEAKSGRWSEGGWPEQWTDYAVSKMALNAYTRVLARRYRGKGLSVNSYCPGFTQTGMTGGKGTHTADAAAEAAATLALLPPEELASGEFFVWSETSLAVHSRL